MDEQALKKIMDSRAEAPDENDRKAAINLALAAFDEAQKEQSNNISQGVSFWGRLTGRSNPKERRDPMNRKLIYGGMATAMVVVLASGASYQYITASTRSGAGDTMTVSLAEQNIADVEAGLKKSESALSVPQGKVLGRIGLNERREMAYSDEPAKQRARVADSAQLMAQAPAVAGSAGAPPAMEMMRMVAPASPPVAMPMPDDTVSSYYQDEGRDRFTDKEINPFKMVSAEPVSTFSIDVDTASYSVVRRMINNGSLPPADAVRIEEMVNYFDYDYKLPEDKAQPFQPSVTVVPSPWAQGRKLVHIAIKGYDIPHDAQPHSNLVFLIDVSGSMNSPDKLPLLKSSMKMLLDTLRPDDTVGIVTYAGNAGVVIEPTKVSEKQKIVDAIDNLQPGGGTAGAAGIEAAYKLAEAHKDKDGVNRVILATDGDFNIGASGPDELKTMIEQKRKTGVFLSVLGFGMGNLNDNLMQTIAQNGNGTAAYIDNLNEARKVLVEEASSTLFPIAKDVKIQVEFNPATVAEYRLIGYETRHLNREDFNNDAVDAGDIGAGHAVTAIYEITPVGGPVLNDPSRYAQAEPKAEEAQADASFGNEYGFLKLRYKLPDGDVSKLITTPIATTESTATGDVAWGVAVAGFAQLLKGGQYMTDYGYDDVINAAQAAKGADEFGYRAEFINMARLAQTLAR